MSIANPSPSHRSMRPSAALVLTGLAIAAAGLLHPLNAPASGDQASSALLSPTPADGNLLANPGFELGYASGPSSWTAVTVHGAGSVAHSWSNRPYSGVAAATIDATGIGTGLWQQNVPVSPGVVYMLTGHLAFRMIDSPGSCRLQVVWRDSAGQILSFVDLPGHDGVRDYELDYPYPLKFRAPGTAAVAEVNCYVQGPGQAWFDDLFFGPAPVGAIAGRVTAQGMPVEGARIAIWGDPWGEAVEALTGADGSYLLDDVPEAFPRYVLISSKTGFRTRPAGRVAVVPSQVTTVNFELEPGMDPPDDLEITYGALAFSRGADPVEVPTTAVIPDDAEGYPPEVRPYLASDDYITADDPAVTALAAQILSSVEPESRHRTHDVAWAVYEWVARNITHDAVFGSQGMPYRDVTSGIWQTIQGEGWCWGRSFYDWAYRPAETLAAGCAICVEHSWLASALLRALNIPARARVGSAQLWVQAPDAPTPFGYWVGLSTNGGSNAYREHGVLGSGFGGSTTPVFFSVTSEPFLHEDWDWERPGLWKERHPWSETYPPTATGRQQAESDLYRFQLIGEVQTGQPVPQSQDRYQVLYSSITLNLFNVGTQRLLDVRFPIPTNSDLHQDEGIHAYWTNHPEAVLGTYIETITNPPVPETQMWFHIELDLSGLVGGPPSPRTPAGRKD